jgi:tetratricopeptide (TPR) repeat protein
MRSYNPSSFLRALSAAVVIGLPLSAMAQADGLAEAQKALKQGQFQQALDKADAYVASKPKDAQGRFLKGLILTEMKRSADAIAIFTKLTEDFPELPEPYNNLAVLYAQQKQFDRARAALEMAIRTHPSYAIAHENLGDVYAKLASQAYDKALQLDSSNSAAQSKLSLIRDIITVSAKPAAKASAGKPAGDPTKLAAGDLMKPMPPAAAPAAAKAAPAAVAAAVPAPTPAPAAAPAKIEKPAPAAEKPAVEKAVEAPAAAAKPAPQQGDADADVGNAVRSWAAAWSRKDLGEYFGHYASDFQTPNGQARKAWESDREARINKPGKIEVGVDNLQVSLSGADKATVKFRQHYKSASLKTSTNKTLVLVRVGGKWLIQQERVG